MAEETNPKKGNDKAPLGSTDYYPSPECPVGWRGDGSGKYPAANPPLHWGRVAKSVKELRSQATKPKEGETGKPIDGTIREWLILGPVPLSAGAPTKDDEGKMEPNEGDKMGGLAWKKISSESQTLSFRDLLGVEKETQAVAYACAYVYSETNRTFMMHVMSSGYRLLVNGVPPKVDQVPPSIGAVINLEKGWNRFLFRVQCAKLDGYASGPEPKWFLRIIFYGVSGKKLGVDSTECESENIAWSTGLSGGLSAPIVVGDKIFVMAELRRLYCLNKSDGKLLWIRTLTLNDVATEEEKKANPEIFQKLAPLAAKLAELDRSLAGGSTFLENNIYSLMAKVDGKKYALFPKNAPAGGMSGPTVTSDGRNVYVASLPYLVACFDLDGNRQWIRKHEMVPPYNGRESHGMYSSPLLLDGKLIVYSDRIFALDAATGKLLWQKPAENDPNEKDNFEGEGGCYSPLGLTMGNEKLLVTAPNIYRVRDGKLLSFFKLTNFAGCIATPVIGDGKIFRIWTTQAGMSGITMVETIRLPASPDEPFKAEFVKGIRVDANRFPRWYCGWYTASPIYYEGLVYCLSEDGVLSVVDPQKQEVVYQKMLDLDLEMTQGGMVRGGACSSLALAGKYIYVSGNHGACVVIEPGREFRQVARNRVENGVYPDVSASCPVFEGKRLYFRTAGALYCIEEK